MCWKSKGQRNTLIILYLILDANCKSKTWLPGCQLNKMKITKFAVFYFNLKSCFFYNVAAAQDNKIQTVKSAIKINLSWPDLRQKTLTSFPVDTQGRQTLWNNNTVNTQPEHFCWQRDKSNLCFHPLFLLFFPLLYSSCIANVSMKNNNFNSHLIINSLDLVGSEWGYFTNTRSRLSQVILEGCWSR